MMNIKKNNSHPLVVTLGSILIALLVSIPSHAQNRGFSCPIAGTVVIVKNDNSAETKVIYNGADPNDQFTCLSTRFSESAPTIGRKTRSFFDYYGEEANIPEARASLESFFSGQKDECSFTYFSRSNGRASFTYHDTWKRIGAEKLSIGGKEYMTEVLERVNENADQHRQGTIKLWFDPTDGVFLKSEASNFQFFLHSNWQVSSVTRP